MLATPVATYFFLGRLTSANPELLTASLAQVQPADRTLTATSASTQPSSSVPSPDKSPWLVEAWLIGVAFFSMRSAGAFLLLERQQRRQSVPVSGGLLDMCLALRRSLGVNRVIRFCECKWLQAPAVIGWFRPVVLLPITALTGLSETQLESVIVHELAHIKRLDAFVNVFQICVETLLFYHPAVWWLNKRIRTEREHCCDDMTIALCGNAVEYARALTLMEEWRSAPVFAMAANRGPLSERIIRLLGLKQVRNTTHRVGLSGSLLCLVAALVAGHALLRITCPKPTAYANGGSLRGLGLGTAAALAQARPAAKADPTAYAGRFETREFEETPWAAGGAFSTAMDMAVFGQMFLQRGTIGGARVLGPATVSAMTTNQIPGVGMQFDDEHFAEASWGLGWRPDHTIISSS